MKRLLIDISHILKACLHAASNNDSAEIVEWEGKQVKLPDPMEGYDIFLKYYENTLEELKMTPIQTILVKDGANCKEMRRKFYEGYCVRPKGHPDWMSRFYTAQEKVEETLLKYGALSVTKDGFEADDIIAALAEKIDCVIWSGDADLLAAGEVYYKGGDFSQKYCGIERKFIPVYKALVGDTSDKIPGAKGFGEAAFRGLLETFGDECLPMLMDMMENENLHQLEEDVAEFKPLQKILDNLDMVYASYKCAKFYHPGWDLRWGAAYPAGNGELQKWEPVMELVTADKLDLVKLKKLIGESPYVSLDIETSSTDEGEAWRQLNKNKKGEMPVDVLGAELTGFSLTIGKNSQHTYYFPVDHKDTNNITLDQAEQILNLLDERITTVIQNTGFELPVIRNHFELRFDRGWLPYNTHDTMIMSGYVDEYESNGLKENSKRYLGYDQTTYEEVTGRVDEAGKKYQLKMRDLTGEEVLHYGCDDTICTASLYRLYKVIMDYEETWNCYSTVDIAAQFIYAERFLNGIKFDFDKLDEIEKDHDEKYQKLYSDIQEFLKNLTWEETVDVKPDVGRITVESLKQLKEAVMNKQEETIIHRWPGCVFDPATEMTPAEIKKVYGQVYGEPFKTNVRKLDKVADFIQELGDIEFAELVRTNNLSGLNEYCEERFVPNPELNLGSWVQLNKLLYEAMGLPVRIRGDLTDKQREAGQVQGNPSSNEDALRHAIVYDLQDSPEERALIEKIIEAKSYRTEKGLFITPYRKLPHPSDGLVHPQFIISAQKSGRGTAKQPNDAQVAKDGGIREVYVPYTPDYVWVSMDFSSQELCHIAVHSGDPNMLSCFQGEWKCIHSLMGSAICRMKDPTMTYERFNVERKTNNELKNVRNKKAKPTNFKKCYGGTEVSLAIELLCSVEEAKVLLDIYDEQFPGVGVWQDKREKLNLERGYAITPMGRRRHIANVLDGTWRDSHEARGGINHEIQGGSAEQVKLVLKELWERRIYEKYDAFFAGTVHDEVNSIVHKNDVVEFIREVHPIMCQDYAGFPVTFKSSIEIGPNFGKLIEIGTTFDEEAIRKVLSEL